MSVCLKLIISVTAEPIGFYSSWNIPTDPVVVLGYVLEGWYTPTPSKKDPPHFFRLKQISRTPTAPLWQSQRKKHPSQQIFPQLSKLM